MRLFAIFLFPVILFASSTTIKPIGKMQLRYENKAQTYSSLGKKLHQSNKIDYNNYVLAGTLGLQTQWDTYSFNTMLYTSLRLHNKNENPLKNEGTLYNDSLHSFAFLGELNIEKKVQKHTFTIGRQTYNMALVNSNEALRYDYEKNNFLFSTLVFHKIASSTQASTVPYNHKYGFLGYGLGYNTTHFTNISQHIINKELSSNEALHFMMHYGDNKSYIEYENLFVNDFFNTSKLTLAHHLNQLYFKVGMISQFSVGKKYVETYIENTQQNKKLRSSLYEAQLQYKGNSFALTYNIAHTTYSKNHIYNGTFLSPFSNKPSWLYGMNTSHTMLANTTSQKISAAKQFHIANIPTTLASGYVYYDIGKHNGISSKEQKTQEWYVHIKQYFSKNLSATLQYSNTKNYDPLTDKSHNTRVILAYSF
jgi:hypothetical protein